MEFIETPIFTKKITELLSLESYKDLQFELLKNPEKGIISLRFRHGGEKITNLC